jgi:hypothetical protein
MRKFLVTAVVLAVVVPAYAEILPGDGHDLASRLGTPMQQVCLPCHTPHSAPYYDEGPLWNHMPSDETFTVHPDQPATLSGSSRLCMGCHDGVTALSNYGGTINGTDMIGGMANIGRDPHAPSVQDARMLADDHPVGVEYPARGPYKDPTTEPYAYGRTVSGHLEDGKIECGTCHGAHSAEPDNGLSSTNRGAYLKWTIQGSQLCRKCHEF